MLVTDTEVVLKRADGNALAFVADMEAGTPIPGATLQQYRAGKIVSSAVTDSRGLADLKTQKEEGDKRVTIVATRGEDEAVVGQNEYRDEEKGDFAVHTYTDRPIYRPGQLIYYKSIVRQKLDSAKRFSVPSGQRVSVEVRDPTGERIHQKQLASNSFGSVFSEIL